MKKVFKIPGHEIVRLVEGVGGCIATDRITIDGCKLDYMYREVTNRDGDSGWRFFAGDESPVYLDIPDHSAIYDVNTIANYEPAILAYISTPAPCAFERVPGSNYFRPVEV